MSQNRQVDHGRVDQLGLGLLKAGLKKYGNPQLQFAAAMLEDEITECLTENLGPGTKAHEFGRRMARALEGGK